MDQVVWLMLMYPVDGHSLWLISKAICGWAKFLYVHESATVAKIIITALVNSEQDIPDDFVVSVGGAPRVRTFTVPVFILTATDFVEGEYEHLLPQEGPPDTAHSSPSSSLGVVHAPVLSAHSDVVMGVVPNADQMEVNQEPLED
jgi:hypothetical protein